MKKIGILTFHASHNYGSMLQNFALQQVLRDLGYACETINFRSQVQRLYCSGQVARPTENVRDVLRKIALFPWRKDLKLKYEKFENFLRKDLACSAQYNTEKEVLKEGLHYDIYLAGGDQIWNVKAKDFSWLYFLPFPAAKKIAYAPSFGDKPTQLLTEQDKVKIKEYLRTFSAVSVREESGADLLASFTNRPQVTLDPTLLLDADQWKKYISPEPLIKGEYLFVYVPYSRPQLLKSIPPGNRLPLVISLPLGISTLYKPNFIKYFQAGPWDFLNLIYYSKGVVSGSFHAAVFAKLFNKPLYCMNMGPGSRIANLEKNFEHLQQDRAQSIQFLREALQ